LSVAQLFLFASFCFLFRVSDAQETTGGVQGRVVDSLGTPVAHANVQVTGPHVIGHRGGLSDSSGYFNILSIPPGEGDVRVTHTAYQPVTFQQVVLELGRTTSLGSVMLRAHIPEMEEIVISRSTTAIDPRSNPHLRFEQFEKLPVDRNYRDMTSLLPDANLSYMSYYEDFGVNIGGATGDENKYFVDGVEVNDPMLGSRSTYLPYNFIQELEVTAGGYGASSRSSLGGLVNVITRSGSNEFHGSVFGFYTGNQFSGNKRRGRLDATQGDFADYDLGLAIGGPIIFDQLWFYAAYNPTFTRQDVDVRGQGIYIDKKRTHAFAGKLSWRATENLNLVFTTTGDPTQNDAVSVPLGSWSFANVDAALQDVKRGGVNYSLSGTYTIGEDILFQGLIARVNRYGVAVGATERARNEIRFVDETNQTISGGTGANYDATRHRTAGKLSATVQLNQHTLIAGLEYTTNSELSISETRGITAKNDGTFWESIERFSGEVSNRIPAAFIQDSWRIFDQLGVTGGVRWEGYSIVGVNGDIVQTVSVPLQPRIGAVYFVDENHTQRIFGSFGRFSQDYVLVRSLHWGSGYAYTFSFDHDPRVDNAGGDTLGARNLPYRTEDKDLRAQFSDEFRLGYEQSMGGNISASLQGVYRTLREAIDDAFLVSERRVVTGNPGHGILSKWPEAQREYTALILTVERHRDEQFNFLASYVLSRIHGNYDGLVDPLLNNGPNVSSLFNSLPDSWVNTTGLLANDRTHVFKFSGSYLFPFGLTAGISVLVQSGTPLSAFASNIYGSIKFLEPRGSGGRTPGLWDLSARLTYAIHVVPGWHSKLILDLFHIASQQTPVVIDTRKYFNFEGTQPNPSYGQVLRYQPPMSVRIGMEVSF